MILLQAQNDGSAAIYMLFTLVLRIIGVIVCVNKAKELNRSSGGWGFFGFLMPIVAMIWVNNLKPNVEWKEENTNQ